MAALEKTIKLTQAQYDTLAAGGTVGSYTGLNENYIYLVEDNDGYVLYSGAQSLTTAQKTQARSNIGAADADSLMKVYYNLGPYDTKSGNTVTRQTGYLRVDPAKLVAHTNSRGLKYYTYLVGAGKQIAPNCAYLGYSWANIWNVQSYGKTYEYNSRDGNLSLLFTTSEIDKGDVAKMVVAYKLDAAISTVLDSVYAPQFSSVYDQKLILDLVYPIGSIYMTIEPANSPSAIYGGEWTQIKDRFLLAVGDTYTSSDKTGGQSSHVHDCSGGDEGLRAQIAFDPGGGAVYAKAVGHGVDATQAAVVNTTTWGSWHTTYSTAVVGYTNATTSIPPYYTVYMWRRTA